MANSGFNLPTGLKAGPVTIDATTGAITTSPKLTIGAYHNAVGGVGYYWHDGDVAQVEIYDRAISLSEVQQNYNATRGRFGI